MLIDIGANLTHDSFDHDREAVIDRAREHGVSRMIVTGTTVQGSSDAAALAAQYAGVLYATAGVHPHHASEYDAMATDTLREIASRPEVVSIGECGLDFFRNYSTPEEQERAFEAQLALAVETGLPVFLHQRDALERWLDILKQFRPKLSRAVAHCFTGDKDALTACLDLDLYIGITGWICDERRGTHLRDLLHLVPAERLMLETDAPYLLPRDLKPKPDSRRNEPYRLAHIRDVVARVLGESPDVLAHRTTRNAEEFFGLVED